MMREMDFVDEYYADKDLSLLKKLTLVIPTYNRNYYLSRCLWYHAHFPFGEIIVADSSPEEKKIVNRETIAKIREMFGANVRYLEYEPETEKYGGDIYRKWGDAVQHVETEYTQVCTDKAFKMPLSEIECIDFLEKNDTYFSALFGRDCNFDGDGSVNNIYYVHESLKQTEGMNTPREFLRFHSAIASGWAASTLLNVTRTKILMSIYATMFQNNISDIRFGELYLGYTGYIYGKCHFEQNGIASIRDTHKVNKNEIVSPHTKRTGSQNSSTTRYPNIPNYEYMGIQEGRDHMNNYYDAINRQLKSNGLNRHESEKFIKDRLQYIILTEYGWLPKNPVLVNIYKRYPIVSRIYGSIPESGKKLLVGLFHPVQNKTNTADKAVQSSISEIVQKVIVETDRDYDGDVVVHYLHQ